MRTMIRLDWRPWLYFTGPSAAGDDPSMDAYILSIRNQFRTTLDGDGLHTNWLVSDIAKWIGVSDSRGHCFVVYHRNAGVSTGPAWLFVLPGQGNNIPSRFSYVMGNNSDVEQSPYFQNSNGAGSIGSDQGSFAVHYNPTGATTTPYNGGWDANGELVGGDFAAPTFNPYTNISDFMPSPQLIGQCFRLTSNTSYRTAFIFDSDIPFVCTYFCYSHLYHINQANIAGKILVPYLDTDPYQDGTLVCNLLTPTTSTFSVFGHHRIYGFDPQGVVQIYTIWETLLYTFDNAPLSNGEYPWEPIAVANPQNTKGYIHTEVMRMIGRANEQHQVLFHGGNLIKTHNQFAMPFVQGEPVFPGG